MKIDTRALLVVCILVVGFTSAVDAQTPSVAKSSATKQLKISASYFSAGAHTGEHWTAELAPDGSLSVKVSHMTFGGETTSLYRSNNDRVAKLIAALSQASFFDLREEIEPTVPTGFHQPHLRLTVTLGARGRSVAIYDPKTVGSTQERTRFFIIWNALFSDLPFKPIVDTER